jgi:hypothetical protein
MKNASARFPRFILLFAFITIGALLKAQGQLPAQAIEFNAGYSKHGSGDMNGIFFGAGYTKYVAKRFSLNYNFRGTINDSKEKITVTTPGGTHDASIRFTTAGVQLGVNAGWNIMRNQTGDLILSLGGFGRYQSASNGDDGYALYYPTQTGVPTVLVGYNNQTPQETFNVGGILQLQFNVNVSKSYYIGALGAFQTDTNGDVILQTGIAIGRRLK